jgi:hypothetical protein
MAGRTGTLQGPYILFVESNSGRNQPRHTFTIHAATRKGNWRIARLADILSPFRPPNYS